MIASFVCRLSPLQLLLSAAIRRSESLAASGKRVAERELAMRVRVCRTMSTQTTTRPTGQKHSLIAGNKVLNAAAAVQQASTIQDTLRSYSAGVYFV